jgi:hypothetical protein
LPKIFTVTSDESLYTAAVSRIYLLMGVIGAIGALLALCWIGWRDAVGFFSGSVMAWLNFRWVHRLVDAVGQRADSGKGPRKRSAIFLGLRYLFLGVAGYAIVKGFGISLISLFAGLAVPVAAVVLEVIYELTYART